jgi:hypothetical protein
MEQYEIMTTLPQELHPCLHHWNHWQQSQKSKRYG